MKGRPHLPKSAVRNGPSSTEQEYDAQRAQASDRSLPRIMTSPFVPLDWTSSEEEAHQDEQQQRSRSKQTSGQQNPRGADEVVGISSWSQQSQPEIHSPPLEPVDYDEVEDEDAYPQDHWGMSEQSESSYDNASEDTGYSLDDPHINTNSMSSDQRRHRDTIRNGDGSSSQEGIPSREQSPRHSSLQAYPAHWPGPVTCTFFWDHTVTTRIDLNLDELGRSVMRAPAHAIYHRLRTQTVKKLTNDGYILDQGRGERLYDVRVVCPYHEGGTGPSGCGSMRRETKPQDGMRLLRILQLAIRDSPSVWFEFKVRDCDKREVLHIRQALFQDESEDSSSGDTDSYRTARERQSGDSDDGRDIALASGEEHESLNRDPGDADSDGHAKDLSTSLFEEEEMTLEEYHRTKGAPAAGHDASDSGMPNRNIR